MSQIFSLHELADRLVIGERFVLTHQDMIWDRTPAYHVGDARRDYVARPPRRSRSPTTWGSSRSTRRGTPRARWARARSRDGRPARRRPSRRPRGSRGSRAEPLDDRPYLLMVGSSFRHKNRVFAFRLLERLVDEAGTEGSSSSEGRAGRGRRCRRNDGSRDAHPALNGRVCSLGHVRGGRALALYRDAELVLFPSLYEGFGFIPFEAAVLGTASVYTRRSSMGELLPEAGRLSSFDLDEAAEQCSGCSRGPTSARGSSPRSRRGLRR